MEISLFDQYFPSMGTGQRITEVKKAAVIVAAISGVQPGGDNHDAAIFTSAIRNFYNAMESMARMYGASINPFTGQLITVFFGVNENDGKVLPQVLNMSMEIRSRIEEMIDAQELPEGTQVSIALNAGEAFMIASGSGKSKQTALIGDTVELATRILDLADGGQILVASELHRETQHLFEYHPLEPVTVKGQRKPVPIFELKGKKNGARGESPISSRMIASALVGRTGEIRAVEEIFKHLLNGRGGVLTIEGSPGVGKTRLIHEIRTADIAGKLIFLEGRAFSEGTNQSFHPLIKLLRSWFNINEEDNPHAAFEKLSSHIRSISPEQFPEIIPFIATMMGYPLDPNARQRIRGIEGEALEKLILKSIRDLLSRAASSNPMVILIEDAHWCDLTTISFLESLFKLARNHRLLFINVFRPGFKETGERIKSFLRDNLPGHSREIIIHPLNEAESAELIDNLMNQSGLPEEIRALIIGRAGGNPFFIEEVIRSFIDEGLVEIKEDAFLVTDQVKYANIPETIDKVILSRIERLDEKTKSLLRTASVIGHNFYYKVLEEATQTFKELDARLEFLTEAQLLNEQNHKEDVEFLFKHALAQQATYDSILQNTRKNLHLKIAHSIEKVFADKLHEFYGILAMHYSKAEVQDKKEEYLVKAGDEAFRSGASTEAMNFYLEAIRGMPVPGPGNEEEYQKYKELEIKIGFAQEAAGNNIEAIESFQKIIEKYFGQNFPTREYQNKLRGIRGMIGVYLKMNFESLFFRKPPDEQFDTFMKVITEWGEAMTSLNPRQLFLQLVYFLNKMANYDLSRSVPGLSIFVESASMFMWTGLSFRTSHKIIDYARRAGAENNPSSFIDYRYIRKMHDFHVGRLEEDRDFESVYQTAMRIGDFWPCTIYTLYSGMVCMEIGNYQGFIARITKLEEISESFDNSHAKAQAYRLSSLAHYRFGKIDRALAIAEEGIRFTGKTGHFSMLLVIWCAKSLAHSARQERKEAKKALSEADKLIADRKIMTVYHVPYLQAKIQVGLAQMRDDLAHDKTDKKLVQNLLLTIDEYVRQAHKMRSAEVEAYRLKGSICWILRKQRKACKYYMLSIQAGQKYSCSLELSRTYFSVGKCLRETHARKSSLMGLTSSEYLLKARTMFEEMDLQQDLKEYEDYMEG